MIARCFTLLIVLCLLVGCGSSTPDTPTLGEPAPPLELPTLDGDTVQLDSLRGNVVLLNFWASWCEPCTREMPRFQQWYEQHQSDGLVILGVNTLYQDQRAAVDEFLRMQPVTYPILIDEQGETSRQWLVRNLPYSYVIDRDGVVRFLKLGEVTEQELNEQILPLLAP